MRTLPIIGIVAFALLAQVVQADSAVVNTSITTSVNTGGHSANGADGEDGERGTAGSSGADGRDGEDGKVVEGKSSTSVSITTVVDGKTVERHDVSTSGSYSTSTKVSAPGIESTTAIRAAASSDTQGEQEEESVTLSSSTPQVNKPDAAAAAIVTAEAETAGGLIGFIGDIAGALSAFFYGIFSF